MTKAEIKHCECCGRLLTDDEIQSGDNLCYYCYNDISQDIERGTNDTHDRYGYIRT